MQFSKLLKSAKSEEVIQVAKLQIIHPDNIFTVQGAVSCTPELGEKTCKFSILHRTKHQNVMFYNIWVKVLDTQLCDFAMGLEKGEEIVVSGTISVAGITQANWDSHCSKNKTPQGVPPLSPWMNVKAHEIGLIDPESLSFFSKSSYDSD